MAFNAAGRGSRGENISHFTGVRLRMVGSGELKMKFLSLDETNYYDLMPLPLAVTTNVEPFRGANFVEQRCAFKGYTTDIDEVFSINRIVIFGKELWAEYPQVS